MQLCISINYWWLHWFLCSLLLKINILSMIIMSHKALQTRIRVFSMYNES